MIIPLIFFTAGVYAGVYVSDRHGLTFTTISSPFVKLRRFVQDAYKEQKKIDSESDSSKDAIHLNKQQY